MLILIAESKTMAPCLNNITPQEFERHKAPFLSQAVELVNSLKGLDLSQLASETGLSAPMCKKLRQMLLDFNDISKGSIAIEAFTGVVYKAFNYESLSAEQTEFAAEHIRIISSLYGILSPDDIVKPYRVDFTMHLGAKSESLALDRRPYVTEYLLDFIRTNKIKEVLNLLPFDAAKTVDMQALSAVCDIRKVDFKELQSGENVRTPHASRLKTLRGKLLRQIVIEGVTNFKEVMNLSSEDFIPHGDDDNGDIVFYTAE